MHNRLLSNEEDEDEAHVRQGGHRNVNEQMHLPVPATAPQIKHSGVLFKHEISVLEGRSGGKEVGEAREDKTEVDRGQS